VGDDAGLSEDGVASIKLPSPCPPTGILEWGEPDDAGVLELRMEIVHTVGETRLDASGGVPSRTRAAINQLYQQRVGDRGGYVPRRARPGRELRAAGREDRRDLLRWRREAPACADAAGWCDGAAVPPGTSGLEMTVEQRGFWPATQKLKRKAGKLPTLAFDGPQAINVRDLEAHPCGNDSNMVVKVVLGQVKDARAKVEAVFAKGRITTITPSAQLVRDLDASMLSPSGTRWDRFNHTISQGVDPDLLRLT
jgi:hypothetical protein